MFGPNVRNSINIDLDYHHREDKFFNIYKEIQSVFRKKFSVDDSVEIVVITGSGTLAVETVINSYKGTFSVLGADGVFKNRWAALAKHYGKADKDGKKFLVQLETSSSHLNDLKEHKPFALDCISAFPYYDIPRDTDIAITVSSKILGAAPVLGIVLFKHDVLKDMIDFDDFTYLNLRRMYEYGLQGQTPHTPAIPLYEDLLRKLRDFDLAAVRAQIKYNSGLIVDALGKENFIGETVCPVLTFKNEVPIPKEFLKRHPLYGKANAGLKDSHFQVFTYSDTKAAYERLADDLRKIKA
jgi:aspartate aminotransferase-like enzyme